jgi:hypothetical protein
MGALVEAHHMRLPPERFDLHVGDACDASLQKKALIINALEACHYKVNCWNIYNFPEMYKSCPEMYKSGFSVLLNFAM